MISVSMPIFTRWLAAGVLAVNCAMAGLGYFSLQQSRQNYEQWAGDTAENLARLLEQYVGGLIRGIDQNMIAVAHEIEQHWVSGGIDDNHLNSFLEQQRRHQHKEIAFRVSDDRGILRYGTRVDPENPVDVSDRDHFIRVRDNRDAGLVISRPVMGRTDKQWILPLGRSYRKADGSFGGAVFALVPLELLSKIFSTLEIGEQGIVVLFDPERNFVARHPEPKALGTSIGLKLGSPQIIDLIDKRKLLTATYRAQSTTDGKRRTYSYRPVLDHPLLVMVGLAEDDYLVLWRKNSWWMGGLVLSFALLTILSGMVAHRAWKQRSAAKEELVRQETLYTASLRQERERLYNILWGTGVGTWEWNVQTGETRFNERWAEIVGYRLDELSPVNIDTWMRLAHPDDLAISKETLERHFRGETDHYECEARMRHKDGRWVWVLDRGKVISRSADGKPLWMAGTHFDITERKIAETEVKRLGDEMKTILQSAGEGIHGDDLDGRVTFANAAAARLLGWKQDELLGQMSHEAFHHTRSDETPYPPADCPIHHTAVDGQQRKVEDDLFWRKDGTSFPVQYVVSPRWEGDRIVGTVVVFEDITDRKRAEGELQRSNAEFKQFSYAISHDLQEPLRGVINFLTLLERRHKDRLEADAQEYIQFAVDGARRMSDMIRDLLEFSRVQTRASEPEPVNTEETVRTAIDNLSAAIEEAGAEVVMGSGLPVVMGNAAQLTRVFQNLIGNGIKYRDSSRSPKVTVEVKSADGKWLFSVADNGIGIEPKFFEQIFGVFQRLHGRDQYEGTGIGLAVVKRIVEQHGGRIWCVLGMPDYLEVQVLSPV